MEKIKVLIVEDALLVAQDLKSTLETHGFEVTDTLTTGEEAIKKASSDVPDLILMDIQLAGELDGISTVEKIHSLNKIPVIYLSDHEDEITVQRAKKTFPAGYLSKPFRANEVLRTLELAFQNTYKNNENIKSKLTDRIFIRTENQTSEMIAYADILYLEADRAYSYVITLHKKYTLSNNMKNIFEQFESPDFIRVHRSFVINVNKITGIEGNMIKLGDDKQVQMSSNYKEDLMSRINLIK
jgi:DNA-binding LytR/AlgR family response regulator